MKETHKHILIYTKTSSILPVQFEPDVVFKTNFEDWVVCGIFDVEETVVEVAVDGDDNVEVLDEILLWLVPGRFVDCVVGVLLDDVKLWLIVGRVADVEEIAVEVKGNVDVEDEDGVEVPLGDDVNDERWVVVGEIVVVEDNDIIEDTVVEPLDDVILWLVVVGFVDVNGKVVLLDVIVLLDDDDDDDVVDLRVVVVGQFV
jgi:hypothetical protein